MVFGAGLALIGFMLSPLTWWNDLFINWPLAYFLASATNCFAPSLFEPALYLSYLATNILGLYLMHRGIALGASKRTERFTLKSITAQLLTILAYTIVVVILVRVGIIVPMR